MPVGPAKRPQNRLAFVSPLQSYLRETSDISEAIAGVRVGWLHFPGAREGFLLYLSVPQDKTGSDQRPDLSLRCEGPLRQVPAFAS